MFMAFCYFRAPTQWLMKAMLNIYKQLIAAEVKVRSKDCIQWILLLVWQFVTARARRGPPFLRLIPHWQPSARGFISGLYCVTMVPTSCLLTLMCRLVELKRSEHFASFGEVATEMLTTSEESGWMNSTTGQRKTFNCSFKLCFPECNTDLCPLLGLCTLHVQEGLAHLCPHTQDTS